ncbi:MAG: hypothetical protein B7Y52_06115 [Sulfurovum sp. 28-43-6]|nr:MAG: hypothetical protein B7Y63_02780 [Sulfurovum sp. 35-42-20]OYY55125.1 MAG: hypothetical protein B7Y52_06115 [Sulfurovum sp. 28-43-6]OYZ25914.1 MAG: hypothetical protein B7Y23_03615 [Sulfurovum sp. 16-42-52]OYZ48409.1 MAG: hypothetical protein B7Y13_07755 [Sulfurovum sp. 24-42-9]OZA46803.1 MAG: hypothetical protein B7X80_01005 [Sulfurovum sp. 17-42-90]OZA59999.1 MAG: hypothetical protein B7X69_05600 [Sulfurovum sp. 39-42-12]
MKEMDDFRKEFENMSAKNFVAPLENCMDGSCEADEAVDLKDYPSYTEALYAKLVAPYVSGIYISKWDIKNIALEAGDSMAIHPRKRMFELLMKFATTKENMQSVLDALEEHMEDKIDIYTECMTKFPSTAVVFEPKIAKARRTIKFFPQIVEEYFED